MSKTEIKIEIESDGNLAISPSGPITRTVSVNDKMVYMDRMTAEMYSNDDPIRGLEIFLLGLKKGQGRYNGRTNTGKFVGFFKKIRRKLFGK